MSDVKYLNIAIFESCQTLIIHFIIDCRSIVGPLPEAPISARANVSATALRNGRRLCGLSQIYPRQILKLRALLCRSSVWDKTQGIREQSPTLKAVMASESTFWKTILLILSSKQKLSVRVMTCGSDLKAVGVGGSVRCNILAQTNQCGYPCSSPVPYQRLSVLFC